MSSLDILIFHVPIPDTDAVLDALFAVGAGQLGNYDSCAFVTVGTGQFRPLPGANPTLGQVGKLEHVKENRVEVAFPHRLHHPVVAALRESHPYEEPSFHIIPGACQG